MPFCTVDQSDGARGDVTFVEVNNVFFFHADTQRCKQFSLDVVPYATFNEVVLIIMNVVLINETNKEVV